MSPEHVPGSLGSHLRLLRADASGTLAEVAQATRIGERQLQALEADDFTSLPAPVFVKGFIRAYCEHFRAPSDDALALYRQSIGAPIREEPRSVASRPRRSWAGHPLVVSSVLVVLFGGGLAALDFLGPRSGSAPRPERLAQTGETRPAPAEEPAAPVQSSPSATPSPVEAAAVDGQRLLVKAVEATWIRVQTDDGRVVEETLSPGTLREWTSGKRFVLSVGNAGGVELQLNGRPLPSLGARGAVIRRISLPEASAGS